MASDNPWQKLIAEPEFQDAIDKNGYYESNLSFQPFVKKYELTLKSVNRFLVRQSKVLIKNKLYVLRTGKGRFVIFSEERFRKPYLELRKGDTVIDISIGLPESHEHLRKAFKNHYQEATNLEYLRFIGVYDKLLEELFGISNNTREFLTRLRTE